MVETNPLESPRSSFDLDSTREPLTGVPAQSGLQEVDFNGETVYLDSTDWRKSTLLRIQIIASFLVFIMFGLGEQTLGTLLPEIQDHYNINDVQVSMLFLALVAGYFIMALLSDITHTRVGVSGVVVMGSCSTAFAFFVVLAKPWFIVVLMCYVLIGIGCGSLDASLNTWMGNLEDSNPLLGILHGCYGIGCMISPPLITYLVEKPNNPWAWNQYYYVLTAVGVITVLSLYFSFHYETPAKYMYVMQQKHKTEEVEMWESQPKTSGFETHETEIESESQNELETNETESGEDQSKFEPSKSPEYVPPSDHEPSITPATIKESLHYPLVWALAIVLFAYIGSEVSFGAWLISYMLRIKKISYKTSLYVATSFWSGLATGRIVLGFVTAHYFRTELTANLVYIYASTLGVFVFVLLSQTSWIAPVLLCVFVTGVFVGPVFPTTIMCSLKLLPVKYHASGVGFICAFGGGGAAALPFLVGLVAESSDKGLSTYPIIMGSMYFLLLVLWLFTLTKYGGRYRIKLSR